MLFVILVSLFPFLFFFFFMGSPTYYVGQVGMSCHTSAFERAQYSRRIEMKKKNVKGGEWELAKKGILGRE